MGTVTSWGPVVFEVLVPIGVLILGGLMHTVYRMGLLTQEVKRLREDLDRMWTTQQGVITYRKETKSESPN